MIRTTLFAAVALATIPAAANAVTYDAFTSFDGTQGAGNFYYGEANPATPGISGTFFSANTNCFIDNATCLQRSANHDVPGFTKGGSPAFQYGTVNVPNDRLLGHPANDDGDTFIAFVAPTAGRYRYTASFNVQDISPTGVAIDLIKTTTGGLPLIFTPAGAINAQNPTFTTSGVLTLGASEAFGFGLNRAGSYNNDSTGVNFTVSSFVPEPAQWALLIGGLGLVGAVSRRRRSNAVFA
jgi:hypothetical protein